MKAHLCESRASFLKGTYPVITGTVFKLDPKADFDGLQRVSAPLFVAFFLAESDRIFALPIQMTLRILHKKRLDDSLFLACDTIHANGDWVG